MTHRNEKGILVWDLSYESSKQKAKDAYRNIGTLSCPALDNEQVSFSRIGFNHLIRKGHTLRPKKEQIRRFVLIQYVEQVILDEDAIILFRESLVKENVNIQGKKVMQESNAKFWTFVSYIKGCKIKVVIRQLNNGKKHFLSVFGDRVFVQETGIKKSLKE